MDTLRFEFPATTPVSSSAHVGVVGSGDLEILLQPTDQPRTSIQVRTSINGFNETWENVLERFLSYHDICADVIINDFGATPGVVSMRLAQLMEVSRQYA
ncbi:malonate decarboxylase subunit delta [Bacillus sp. FJAT-44742]|uniref:malonate decarboxylase subunit delta n=1 Tax=Bacillus sp. FJAT-44742 TaxID=2014005 RepID=UPI000C23066B|nr:malonate decarboxylase subunit delta [Bacillus sp. FJAT-44742]